MSWMKLLQTFRLVAICALLCVGLTACAGPKNDLAAPAGPWLGEEPPGTIPQVFASGLVSTDDDEGGLVITPGGDEILFWRVSAESTGVTAMIYSTRFVDGGWTTPEIVPFSGTYVDGYLAMHPDGSRLYFQSNRPIDPDESVHEYNIWYVDREGEGWGEPRSIGRPINGLNITGGPSVTNNGSMYFTIMDLDSGHQQLYRSELIDGIYQEPVKLPEAINARYQTCDSYVAPDESYLVFPAYERAGHAGNPGVLYISFRSAEGVWTMARELGAAINSGDQIGSATITADGRYLFFSRRDPDGQTGMDIYWVDAAILEDLQQQP